MNLRSTLENVDAFLGGNNRIAVKVGGPLLEFGEVLDALQTALRAEKPLDIDAAQRWCLDSVAELLRPDIADFVIGAVRVPVGVAIEAGNTASGAQRAAIFGLVELLLRE